MVDIKSYTEANRLAWNEVAPRHQRANKKRWDEAFAQPGYVSMPAREVKLLQEIGVAGKDVVQLCCNNGVELMSLKNLGAKRCVGIDICDNAIAEASQRAVSAAIDCEFVRADVYDLNVCDLDVYSTNEQYRDRFDIAYVSAGALVWMPDLNVFLKIVSAMLRENGKLFIHEIHPLAQILSRNDQTQYKPLEIVRSYFSNTPFSEVTGLDYLGGHKYPSKVFYLYIWTLSDIVMGILNNDMDLAHLSEYTDDLSHYRRLQDLSRAVPLSYIMVAEKRAKLK